MSIEECNVRVKRIQLQSSSPRNSECPKRFTTAMPPPIPASTNSPASEPSEPSEPDAIVAMSVAQAVPPPTDFNRPTIETGLSLVRRVDLPIQEEDSAEEMEVERGLATMWLKDNQLMLTYFVAGKSLVFFPRACGAVPDDIASVVEGGLAGAASRTVVSPLERLKIILQVQPRDTGKNATAKAKAAGKAYGGVWASL
jgi:hypothetical protein